MKNHCGREMSLLNPLSQVWTAKRGLAIHGPAVQQGPQASLIQFRWFDGRVCPHAGGWNGKRSPRRLFPLSAAPAALEDCIFHVTKSVEMALKRDKFVIS